MEMASPHSGYIDLHIHSTASDGSLSPGEIIGAAKKIGLRAVAITDHDTVEGSAEVLGHPQSPSLEILSGVEVSADFLSGNVHILGYLIQLDDFDLVRTLGVLQQARAERNVQIVEKLQRLGIDITYEEVLRTSGGGQTGRPHIAQVLVQKGVARSMADAFKKYLNRRGPAYVARYRLPAAEAIEMILNSGGVPVLAHPYTLHARGEAELEDMLKTLKDAGLQGIEVYYPEHGPKRTGQYERLARRHELLMTGGTDFHGAAKPGAQIGIGWGDLRVPYQLVVELKNSRPRCTGTS